MFCQKCGSEINDAAVVCPNCGCPTSNNTYSTQFTRHQLYDSPVSTAETVVDNEKASLATCALAFSFLMPIVGFILGIIGTIKYKTSKYRNQSIIAIPVSIVVWIINIIIFRLCQI